MTHHRQGKFRSSIFTKALMSIVLATALPISGLWYFSSYQFQKNLDDKINDHFAHIGEQLANQIDSWKEMNTRLLIQVSQLGAIQSGGHQQQNPVLESITKTYEWVYLAYVLDKSGYMTGRSDAKNRPVHQADGRQAHYRGDRHYYQAIMTGDDFSEELLINRTHAKPALILCKANQDPKQPHVQGALCLAMTVEALSDAVTDVSVGHTGYAILLDQDNRVIAHGNPKIRSKNLQDMSASPLVRASIKGKPYIFIDTDGTKKIAYQKNTAEGWKLFIEQEYSDAFSALNTSTYSAWFFFVVTVLVSVAIAFLMARQLTLPIKAITRIANNVSRGEYHHRVESYRFSNDEMGDLQEAVERMRKTIKIVMKRIKTP